MKKLIILTLLLGTAQLHAQRCATNLSLTSPELTSPVLRQATNKIMTSVNYRVNPGQNVTHRAGVLIEMKANTHIRPGSFFLAEIGACTARGVSEEDAPVKLADTPGLKTYPNPVQSVLNVTVDGDKMTEVTVTTLEGRIVDRLDAKNEPSLQIDCSRYPPGIYLLTANTASGKVVRHKIYKE
jgi:hypothetical protein